MISDSEGVSDGKRVSFKIPVSSASGNWDVTLRVLDADSETPQSSERVYSLKIDNTKPAFKDGQNEDDLVLFKNGYGSDGTKIDNSGNYVQNSNGSIFTIASSVEEAGSGFKNAAVYFERSYQKEGKRRIFNVRKEYGDSRGENAPAGRHGGRGFWQDLCDAGRQRAGVEQDGDLPRPVCQGHRPAARRPSRRPHLRRCSR